MHRTTALRESNPISKKNFFFKNGGRFPARLRLLLVMVQWFKYNTLFLILLLFLSSCYTVEFKPASDYPNLHRNVNSDEVKILYGRPEGNLDFLGTMIIRDFSGNIKDRAFKRWIRSEAASRGGSLLWVRSSAIHRERSIQINDGPIRPGARPHTPSPNDIRMNIGTVHALLYNPARSAP